MKKKIVAIALVGIMTLSNFVPAFASQNSASKSGSTAAFSATGTITVDNVNNTATATATSSVACGMDVTAIFRYKNTYGTVKTEQSKNTGYGTSCTAVAQKTGVQAVSATGIFVVVNGTYTWSDSCDVPVK